MVKRTYSQMSSGKKALTFKLGGRTVFSTKRKFQPKRKYTGPVQEIKFLDNTIAFNFDGTNEIPATGQLLTIAQGDGQSNREGRKIVVKSIYVKGIVQTQPGASAVAGDVLYIWLVQDTQCNGAAAIVADDNTGIFTAAGASASAAVRCLANVNRFKILKKWVLPTFPQAGNSGALNHAATEWSGMLNCNIPIEYDASAATGALATIRSNNIFLVAGSHLTDDTCACSGIIRIRFQG